MLHMCGEGSVFTDNLATHGMSLFSEGSAGLTPSVQRRRVSKPESQNWPNNTTHKTYFEYNTAG